jgi:RNA polymerase sigma-70 factor (ECF subfamily)
MDSAGLTDQEPDLRLVQLMVAYQSGDLDAFQQLYGALAEHLRHYFRNAEHDRSVAEDLVQDTFLEMHRSRRTYAPPLPVRPWVFGVARNVLARRRRAAHSHRQHTQVLGDDDVMPTTPTNEVPVSDVIDLERALSGLPTSTREPWLLHHIFGLSFDSIAARLGITAMAAKLRSSRATQALRSALSGNRKEAR